MMNRLAVLTFILISHLAFSQSMFHGNLAHTGVYDSSGPKESGGVKWAFHTGAAIVASPAIADGVVYIPSMDAHLYAIDQETGK
jgi:outer membrane protein assembly factor BamB